MKRVLACIDGSIYSESVADNAAWAAGRLGASIELLQVIGRREAVASQDRSGRIMPKARRQLLEQLAAVDSQRAKLLQQQARMDLEAAKSRINDAGVQEVTETLRHGDLLDALAEREVDAELVVIGKRGEAADFAKLHLGSNLERIVRASHRPVLITARAFHPVKKVLLAFDGGPSATKAVDAMRHSPLFAETSVDLVTVGEARGAAQRKLDDAGDQLRTAGLEVNSRIEPGQPETVIAEAVERDHIDLLVMGAYGHSRLRSLVIGSTTSEMIRACRIPILLYR
ncbi:MAG: universal stress protein [Pseudomonadota bacterium]